MKVFLVPDDNNLFRHSVHPTSFKGNNFAPEKHLKLNDVNGDERLIEASVAWQRYLPTTEHVHLYGCKLAFKRNEKARNNGKFKEKSRQVYCGAYQIKAHAVRSIINELPEMDVGDFDVEAIKTAIIDRLWNASCGPLRHVCDCDRDLADHPSSKLPDAPMGGSVEVSYTELVVDEIPPH